MAAVSALDAPFQAVDGALDLGHLGLVEGAHLLADELHLAPAALVVGDGLALEDGVAHVLRHRHPLDAVARRLDQRLRPAFCRASDLAFEFGFGRAFVLLLEFGRAEADGAAVGIYHDINFRFGTWPHL
jgi:hypothetical protein